MASMRLGSGKLVRVEDNRHDELLHPTRVQLHVKHVPRCRPPQIKPVSTEKLNWDLKAMLGLLLPENAVSEVGGGERGGNPVGAVGRNLVDHASWLAHSLCVLRFCKV